jgi:hypothetical protein
MGAASRVVAIPSRTRPSHRADTHRADTARLGFGSDTARFGGTIVTWFLFLGRIGSAMFRHDSLAAVLSFMVLAVAWMLGGAAAAGAAAPPAVEKPYFGIQVIDRQTGRGVPLVELRTVNEIVLHTDSAGWAAFHEPGLMDREVWFFVSSPGYEHPADGFGSRGVRLTTTPGALATVKLNRTNIAERLYRVTGQGIYRHTALLGLKPPMETPHLNTGVMGQDSVQAVPYRRGVFWLWGDTGEPHYPLGNFHTSAATSPLPGPDTFQPTHGVPLIYFADPRRPDRVRRMAPLEGPGMVWLFGLLSVRDPQGAETLVAHYARMKSLGEMLEHGLVRFDDEEGVFKRIVAFDLNEKWRHPRGNAVRVRHDGQEYFYFAERFAPTRVRADWASLIDPGGYEALAYDASTRALRWQRDAPPTTQDDEAKLIREGKMKPEHARCQLADAATGQPVVIHRGSIRWNAFRKRWVLIGNQVDQAATVSLLGEVWYAEADDPSGPWRSAVKVATHPHYSLYNPCHHEFFDEEGGRVIHFEGTYTRMFERTQVGTPRYEYNQMMYRLDLSDERLEAAR